MAKSLRESALENFGTGVTWIGTQGDDRFIGTAGNDVLFGEAGRDTLWGDGGHDLLFGGRGSDTLYGGDGNDLLWTSTYPNDLNEKGFSEFAYGGNGDDTIFSSYGADSLFGGEGNDVIWAGLDAGGYRPQFAQGEVLNGGEGNDKLRIEGTRQGLNTIDLETGVVQLGNGSTGTMANFEAITTLGGDFEIFGTDGAETLIGNFQDVTLHGRGGDDYLKLGSSGGVLFGGNGDDMMVIAWSDYNSQDSTAIVTGGAGSDTFRFDSYDDDNINNAANVWTDFNAAEDSIDVSALLFDDYKDLLNNTTFTQTAGGTLIQFNVGQLYVQQIMLENYVGPVEDINFLI